MAIYVQIGKDDIKGNVSAKGHEGWIEFNSMEFGVGRSIPMLVGKQTQRESSNPSLSEVFLGKEMDDASPYLFQDSVRGVGKQVTIHITKTGTDQVENIVEYILGDAMITSYSVKSGGDLPNEDVSFAYTKLEMKYIQWDESHKKSSQVPVSYDLGAAATV